MLHKNYFTLFALIGFLSILGCKSTKTITSGGSNLKLSAKQLIAENAKKSPSFKTLQSKLKITYTEGEKKQAYTVTYRMEKDKVLWMSATLGIVRAKITPQAVAFYNKLDNTFFEGDFEYFSQLLGTELDFQKVQNIILGEALFNLKNTSHTLSVNQEQYMLQPKKQQKLFEILFLLNPSHYKIDSQQIIQEAEKRHLQINYLAHQEIGGQILPEKIKVIAADKNDEFMADLEFKSVSLNQDLRFPFKIPSGFKRIEL
ncbi:DUF4292 domain-containing protein [Flavobacteriaceae bacterium MHTCC 0001]